MITVTVDVRTLDATGPVPTFASVLFARLAPSTLTGTLVTTDTVEVTLNNSGHGTIQLRENTPYEVHCYGLNGFEFPFTIRTGVVAATLADLWQTGQVNPGDFSSRPVPATLQDLLTAQAALFTALYPPLRATPPNPATVPAYIDTSTVPPVLKGWNGTTWVSLGGTTTPPSDAVIVQSSSGGVLTLTGSGVTESGGVLTLTGSNVTQNAGVITIG